MANSRLNAILIEDDEIQADLSLRVISSAFDESIAFQTILSHEIEEKAASLGSADILLINEVNKAALSAAAKNRIRQQSMQVPLLGIVWVTDSSIPPIDFDAPMEIVYVNGRDRIEPLHMVFASVMEAVLLHANRESHYHSKKLADALLLFGLNAATEIFLVNQQVQHLLGHDGNSLFGKKWLDVLLSDAGESSERQRLAQLLHGEDVSLDNEAIVVKAQDGQAHAIHWTQVLIQKDDEGQASHLIYGLSNTPCQHLLDAIRAFEQNSQGLFTSIQEGLVLTDTHRRILHVNAAFTHLFGYTQDEMQGKFTSVLYACAERYREIGLIQRETNPHDPIREVIEFKRKDGSVFPGEIGLHPLLDDEQKILGYISIITDISKRVKAEQEKQEIEESLRRTLVLARLSRWTYQVSREEFCFAEEFHQTFATDASWMCLARSEFLEKWVHPADRARVEAAFQALISQQAATALEFRVTGSDQSMRYVFAHVTQVHCDDAGKPAMIEGYLQDITDRKLAEDRYQRQEQVYQKRFSEIGSGFAVYDVIPDDSGMPSHFVLVELNPEFTKMTGLEAAQVIGKRFDEIFPTTGTDFIRIMTEVASHGKTIELTHHASTQDRWYDLKVFRIEPGQIAILFFDVSERERISREMLQRNKTLNALQEITLELVSEHNVTLLLDNILQRACELFDSSSGFLDFMQPDGYSPLPQVIVGELTHALKFPIKRGEGLTGMVWKSGKPMLVKDYDQWPDRIPKLREKFISSVIGVPLISKGEILGVLVLAKAFGAKADFDESDVEILMQFARLATLAIENAQLLTRSEKELIERIRTEERLIQSEAAFRSLFENVPDGVYRTTVGGKFLAANPAYLKIFGYESFEELSQINVENLYLTPQSRKALHAQFKDNQDTLRTEIVLRRRDGQKISVLDNCRAVRDASGEIVFFEGTITEITARKQAEQLIIQQSEELARLYRASASLITDISNNLEHLAQTIVSTTQQEFNQVNCSVFITQENPRYLKRLALVGPSDNYENYFIMDTTLPGIVSKAYRSRKIINISDVRTDDEYLVNWEAALSELAIPLVIGEKCIGVLDMESSRIDAFSEDDARVLSIFAEKAAFALEQALISDKEQRRIASLLQLQKLGTELSSIHDESAVLGTLVDHAVQLAVCRAAFVFFFDSKQSVLRLAAQNMPAGKEQTAVPFGLKEEGLIQRIKSAGMLMIGDIDQEVPSLRGLIMDPEIKTLSAFSLISEGRTIGVIAVAGDRMTALSKEETTTFELLAKIASTSIVNARLFESTRRSLNRLASLRRIDQAIASSTDLMFTLDVLLEQLMNQLHLDAASVLNLDDYDFSLKYFNGREIRNQTLRHLAIPIGEEFAGKAAFDRVPMIIEDLRIIHQPTHRTQLLLDEGFIGYVCVPIIAKGKVKGVLEGYCRKAFTPDQEWMDYFELISGQAAIAVESVELFSNLQRSNADLSLAYDHTLEGWASALELRDKETEGHTRRVADLALDLATAMDVRPEDLIYIRWGALLHDIGKMAIPDEILLKPGKLTEDEWKIMKQHPQYAFDMLSKIDYLRPALDIPYAHHEKWDGSGYPRGLEGEQIPLAARIFAIIDVWDALTSDRPYRKAWCEEKTLNYILDQKGHHFDPNVVEHFLKVYKLEKPYPELY